MGTLLAAGAQVAPLAASLALSLAIARLYGPSATGIFSLVLNLFGVVLLISGIGLASGITYLVSRQDWALQQASRQTRRAAAALGGAGALLGLGFYLLTRHSIFKGVSSTLAIVSLASVPFALSASFSAAALLGRDRYELYAAVQTTQPLVLLLAGVALAAAFGLTGAVAGFAAANVAAAALGWVWTHRAASTERGPHSNGATSRRPLARATRFGLQAWAANLLQLLNYRLDLFILSAVAARSAVGVYSVAVTVTALGWLLPDALQTVLFPRVASLDAATDAGRMTAAESDAAAARAVRHSVLIVLPTALALAVLVLLVPVLYGSGFRRSVILGFILIPGVAGLGPAKVIAAVVSGRGFPRYGLYATLITLPITLALYLTLITSLHATGAAVASTISYGISIVLGVVFLRKVTAIPLREALIPSRSDLIDYVDAFRAASARVASGLGNQRDR